VAGSLAVNYDIDAINKEEEKRDADIKESIHSQISIFTENLWYFWNLKARILILNPKIFTRSTHLGHYTIRSESLITGENSQLTKLVVWSQII